MTSFNRVILAGNLTRDPELSVTTGGIAVCNLGIAVNRVRSKNEEVDFFDITVWREQGEAVANYKKKGDPILVEGRLQYRTWEAQDGSKRSKVDVVADNVQFLGRANGNGDSTEGQPAAPAASQLTKAQQEARAEKARQREAAKKLLEEDDDADFEDIPF